MPNVKFYTNPTGHLDVRWVRLNVPFSAFNNNRQITTWAEMHRNLV
jgi:hypothetical protein